MAQDIIDRPKSEQGLKPLKALWPFLKPHKKLIAAALLALVAAVWVTLLLPSAVRVMIDEGFAVENAGAIDRYFLYLLGVSVLLALTSSTRYYLVTRLGERVIADIRKKVYRNVIGLSPAFFEETKTGEVLSRLTGDTTLVHTVVGSSASVALRSAFLLIGAVAMMILTSPSLAGTTGLLLPLVLVPIFIFGRKARKASRLAQDAIAAFSAKASEVLNAIPVVQAFTQENNESSVFNERTEAAFHASLKRTRIMATMTAIVITVVFGGVVGVLWMGARQVLGGTLAAGELAEFVLFAVLAAGAVGALSEVWGDLQRAGGAMERLMELATAKSEIEVVNEPVTLPWPFRAEVRFDNVVFAYPASPQKPVLNGLSLTINPGETVALVGASGAGKSTIFQLLLRFYDPQQGVIKVDGVDIKSLNPQHLRSQIALVPQESVIFAANALDNIRYGKPGADEEAVQKAAEDAAAHEFLQQQTQGYETFLGERGVRLSGGQQQRIAIARALLKDAPLLLLDEATSSLDAESERKVQDALEHLMEGRTTLVIAHRLATVKKADRIVVLDQGRIVAEGTHESLLREQGLYQRLARLQFDLEAIS